MQIMMRRKFRLMTKNPQMLVLYLTVCRTGILAGMTGIGPKPADLLTTDLLYDLLTC